MVDLGRRRELVRRAFQIEASLRVETGLFASRVIRAASGENVSGSIDRDSAAKLASGVRFSGAPSDDAFAGRRGVRVPSVIEASGVQ